MLGDIMPAETYGLDKKYCPNPYPSQTITFYLLPEILL